MKIIACAVALLALASQALSCDLWYSVGHSDDKGQVFVEDYNLTHEDCLRYQDDDPTWECWVQTDGLLPKQ